MTQDFELLDPAQDEVDTLTQNFELLDPAQDFDDKTDFATSMGWYPSNKLRTLNSKTMTALHKKFEQIQNIYDKVIWVLRDLPKDQDCSGRIKKLNQLGFKDATQLRNLWNLVTRITVVSQIALYFEAASKINQSAFFIPFIEHGCTTSKNACLEILQSIQPISQEHIKLNSTIKMRAYAKMEEEVSKLKTDLLEEFLRLKNAEVDEIAYLFDTEEDSAVSKDKPKRDIVEIKSQIDEGEKLHYINNKFYELIGDLAYNILGNVNYDKVLDDAIEVQAIYGGPKPAIHQISFKEIDEFYS